MMKRIRSVLLAVANGDVVWPAIAVGAIVAVSSVLIGPKRGNIDVDVGLASMAAFLFSVLLAFTIIRIRERLSLVQNLVAKGNAWLFSIYQAVSVFPEDDRRNIRDLVDRHLTEQIDFPLADHHMAMPSYLALTDAVYGLEPKNAKEEAVYRSLVESCMTMRTDRGLIEAATGQDLSPIEWTGLTVLFFLFDGLVTVLPGGTILGALIAGVLAGTLVTFMILLRRLDRMRWHETVTIWEPTTRLFRSMGRDPYVPREVINSGRYRPTGRVRVVEYPDPYPVRSTKVVSIEELNG